MRETVIPRLAPRRPAGDGEAALAAAVGRAAGALGDCRALTVVLNDPQRETQSPVVLARLAEVIGGVRARALVATGTHRFDADRRRPFEAALAAAMPFEEIAWHDCRSPGLAPVVAGPSWRCHPWLLDESHALLAIGSCEPHYFAGITGAHKTVSIGCAAFEDIERNHAGALSPESRPCRLAGNPVHEGVAAMVEQLTGRRQVCAVDLLQVGGRIVSAAAGGPLEALAALAADVRRAYVCAIAEPADALVVSVDGALARSFYQADKAIKNSECAVRDGGAIVLRAACDDGIGQDAFTELLRRCRTYGSAREAVAGRGYRLGDHKGLKLRRLTDERGVRVVAVSRGLTAADAQVLGFSRADSAEEALAAIGISPSTDKVYEVIDAANTCVVVEGA